MKKKEKNSNHIRVSQFTFCSSRESLICRQSSLQTTVAPSRASRVLPGTDPHGRGPIGPRQAGRIPLMRAGILALPPSLCLSSQHALTEGTHGEVAIATTNLWPTVWLQITNQKKKSKVIFSVFGKCGCISAAFIIFLYMQHVSVRDFGVQRLHDEFWPVAESETLLQDTLFTGEWQLPVFVTTSLAVSPAPSFPKGSADWSGFIRTGPKWFGLDFLFHLSVLKINK